MHLCPQCFSSEILPVHVSYPVVSSEGWVAHYNHIYPAAACWECGYKEYKNHSMEIELLAIEFEHLCDDVENEWYGVSGYISSKL